MVLGFGAVSGAEEVSRGVVAWVFFGATAFCLGGKIGDSRRAVLGGIGGAFVGVSDGGVRGAYANAAGENPKFRSLMHSGGVSGFSPRKVCPRQEWQALSN